MRINLVNYLTATHQDQKLVLKSFEIPLGKKLSIGRFVSVYGNKSTQKVLKEARIRAIKTKEKIYRVNLTLEAGCIPNERIAPENLPDLKFLNIDRCKKELSELIIGIIAETINDIGEFDSLSSLFGDCPELFDLLWEDPQFEHIDAFCWNAPKSSTIPRKFVKLAVVKNDTLFTTVDVQGINTKGMSFQFMA